MCTYAWRRDRVISLAAVLVKLKKNSCAQLQLSRSWLCHTTKRVSLGALQEVHGITNEQLV
eukprot:m.252472 g.252472  ORF g.252472 m.252472 type:complete len:61 (+) comp15473_c2_seq12:346-528(+)